MNILIINGSPRKKGLISQMLDIIRESAESRGDQMQTIYTNDLNIKPCIGCMVCRTKLKCSIAEDDSQRVLKMLQDADAMREICRYSGFKIVATIERGGTAMHPTLSKKDKQKCLKAIRKV